jgi:type I restriction enzyme S subunit
LIEDRTSYKLARMGDIAYNMMRMWQGAVGVVPVDGLVSPAYVVAQPLPVMNSHYFAMVLRTDACKGEINCCSRGIVSDRNRLYWEDFKELFLPVPAQTEQDRIVAFIRMATQETDVAISSADRGIELLREYRTRLIADVVTGKLDVRGVELPELDEGDGWTAREDSEAWDEGEETRDSENGEVADEESEA